MFNRVLVGIDEQSQGRDAILLAQRLVEPHGTLILGHVQRSSPHVQDPPVESASSASQAGVDFLQSVMARAGIRDAAWCVVEADRIETGLHRLAERADADLLVIGSSREGQSGRVWLRDGVRNAINGAPCAVAVAPLHYAELGTPITQIGIAYNGSRESRAALEVGRALAADLDASAVAFQALPWPISDNQASAPEALPLVTRALEDQTRSQLMEESGVSACASCGEAVEELSVFSGSVDLLILGSRDYGPIGRLVHGSTTRSLLGFARSPMLILTRAARAQAERRTTLVRGSAVA